MIATAADLAGGERNRDVVRRGRYISLLAVGFGAALADLGFAHPPAFLQHAEDIPSHIADVDRNLRIVGLRPLQQCNLHGATPGGSSRRHRLAAGRARHPAPGRACRSRDDDLHGSAAFGDQYPLMGGRAARACRSIRRLRACVGGWALIVCDHAA